VFDNALAHRVPGVSVMLPGETIRHGGGDGAELRLGRCRVLLFPF